MNTNNNLGLMINGIPFTPDEDVIGKWEYFDVIDSEEQFNVNSTKTNLANKGFKEIYFLPNGEKYWIFEGWTKGCLFTHSGGDDPIISNNYSIKKINDDMYMFLEVQSDEKPYINILKKTSNKKYVVTEIGNRDNINLPFVMDENVVGLWKSIDFVQDINDFLPHTSKSHTLWLKTICFNNDGIAIREYENETWYGSWTKGKFIDPQKTTASSYEIKLIDNKEYLFVEWKMGNYVYGGAKPNYYVFERFNK